MDEITVTKNRNQRRRQRGGREVKIGYLTPGQLAQRMIQLSEQWHILARQEIAKTGDNNPPSRVDLRRYDEWAKETAKNAASLLAQWDTLKQYDEWRAVYGAHYARVAQILGKEPASMSLEQFDRHRSGFFQDMPWWGWLLLASLAYLIIRELGK